MKNVTLLEQHGVSEVTSFPKPDDWNPYSLPAKCKAWVIALALAGRISYTTATRLIRWLGWRMFDIQPTPAQLFATSGHIPIGFRSLKTISNSNAALLLHTTAAFLLSVFWLNQLVSQIRETFKSASFLSCWSSNLYLARLFRLEAIKASTPTIGAN